MTLNNSEEQVLETFVSSFEYLDEMVVLNKDLDPIAWNLRSGKSKYGYKWKPRKVRTPQTALNELYKKLPAKFPPLYEKLLLTYRWAEVDLGPFRLLANPKGQGLEGFESIMFDDKFLVTFALAAGYIRFGKGQDVNYDPVCFAISQDPGSREFPVVRLDHEAILCHEEIEVVEELAPNFRSLALAVIEVAQKNKKDSA